MAGASQEAAPDPVEREITTADASADLAGLLRRLRRREARRRGGAPLTYRQLAAKTGWSLAAVGEYFSGRTLPPTDRLDVLVRLLGASPAEQAVLATVRDRVEEKRRRAASPTSGPAPTTPRPRGLPADIGGFCGRQAELAELHRLLDDAGGTHAVVICALSGTAGVGKSALAVHWAHRVADRFPDGQLYVNLRGFDPAARPIPAGEAIRGFLDSLGVAPQRRPTDLPGQSALYRSLLAGKRILIVLDNARDADHVRPLLPGTPGCLALVTSRNQLTGLLAGHGAHPLTLDLLSHDEARQLLTHRMGAHRTAAEAAAVDDIITACARLPLALAIVAARAALHPHFPLASLAAELRHTGGLDPFTTGDDPASDVRAVFSWSYHALRPATQRLFRLLALHPGPDITAPAAASLAALPPPAAAGALAELTTAHLLSTPTPGRYTVHDLLRAYADELLHGTEPPAERYAAQQRMLDHYLHTAHTAAVPLDPSRDPITLPPPPPGVRPEHPRTHHTALAWFTTEHKVLLGILNLAAAHDFHTHVWQLAWALAGFLDRRGHWNDLATAGRHAEVAADRLGDLTEQARANRLLAAAHTRLGRYNEAHAHLRQALDLYGRADDRVGRAHTHLHLSDVWERQDRNAEAIAEAQRALELFRAARHQHGQALALNQVGWHYARHGDHRQALISCMHALVLLEELGDRGGQAGTWDSLGYAHHHLGEYDEAISCYGQALKLFADLGDRYGEADTLAHLGETQQATGDAPAAGATWARALSILDDLGHPDAERVRASLRQIDTG